VNDADSHYHQFLLGYLMFRVEDHSDSGAAFEQLFYIGYSL